jgi:hypothetical protein
MSRSARIINGRPARGPALALLACSASLPGCGGDDKPAKPPPTPEQQVRQTWRGAATAAAAGDGTAFCARVSPAGRARITAQTQLPCEDTIRLLASRLSDADRRAVLGARITAVTVTGDQAVVRYVTTPTLSKLGFTGRTTLTRSGGQWLLQGI